MLAIDLYWGVHEKGYVIVDKRTPEKIASGSRGDWMEKYLVGQGRLREQEPLKNWDNGLLCKELMKVENAQSALSFVERFGPLTGDGLYGEGDRVNEITRQAWLMRCYVDPKSRSRPPLKEMLPTPGMTLGTIDVTLVPRPHKTRPELRFTAKDLLAGIWIQFGQAAAGGLQIKRCGRCGTLFEAGPGSEPERRLDAKFCSENCKIVFHSLARTRRD